MVHIRFTKSLMEDILFFLNKYDYDGEKLADNSSKTQSKVEGYKRFDTNSSPEKSFVKTSTVVDLNKQHIFGPR